MGAGVGYLVAPVEPAARRIDPDTGGLHRQPGTRLSGGGAGRSSLLAGRQRAPPSHGSGGGGPSMPGPWFDQRLKKDGCRSDVPAHTEHLRELHAGIVDDVTVNPVRAHCRATPTRFPPLA